eukprot:365910-Chlamydomonas_euryale.AAC.41
MTAAVRFPLPFTRYPFSTVAAPPRSFLTLASWATGHPLPASWATEHPLPASRATGLLRQLSRICLDQAPMRASDAHVEGCEDGGGTAFPALHAQTPSHHASVPVKAPELDVAAILVDSRSDARLQQLFDHRHYLARRVGVRLRWSRKVETTAKPSRYSLTMDATWRP